MKRRTRSRSMSRYQALEKRRCPAAGSCPTLRSCASRISEALATNAANSFLAFSLTSRGVNPLPSGRVEGE